ncbi:MAG: 16S rRNA (cytidine(1402)-2'-O)-methyltransferase [Actinobacteria bacterium]|nr:16S rRNA (cytidine(1402)-2'-O)-methyltransferase [Actinomycetota bacterium]
MESDKRGLGVLYLCATPIGNLKDVTLRVLDTLREVDLVAAEDTRRTRRLFTRHGIHSPMISYREENREKAGARIVERIEQGESVALVSDAGVPGISDPGYHLVRMCLEREIEVQALPGANAALTALVVSGLETRRFAFEGFLPRKKGARRKALEDVASDRRTLIFYESPARAPDTVADIEEVLGDRKMACARELTKRFEQVMRGRVSEVRERLLESPPRGELVLVVEGFSGEVRLSEREALEEVRRLREQGLSLKDAVDRLAGDIPGLSRRVLYNQVLKSQE